MLVSIAAGPVRGNADRPDVVPVHDTRVTFHPRYRFKRVHLEPEGKEPETQRTPDGIRVTVPRLEVHSMVVGELEGEAPR